MSSKTKQPEYLKFICPLIAREIINEIASCLSLPYNIAACNSSGYNYASGRLDHPGIWPGPTETKE